MEVSRTLHIGDRYRHFKGVEYVILSFAECSETGSNMVVYISSETRKIYVRDYDMFASKVDKEKYPEVKQEYRFELVG